MAVGPDPEAEVLFHHEVLFYGHEDEFLDAAMPYLRGAIDAGEPALVAVAPKQTAAIRGELGADAAGVSFVEMGALGRNPARLIPFWRDFLEARGPESIALRGISEPIWPGRTRHELQEWRRHERLVNVAFEDDLPFSLLCPYDTACLADDLLDEAARSHPYRSSRGCRIPNVEWVGTGEPSAVFGESLPPSPGEAGSFEFDRSGLAMVRALVGGEAESSGLDAARASDLVTAASELAANSVAHGGGRGKLSAWRDGGELVVEVVDAGWIEEPLVGRRRPAPGQHGGRGLWIANLLCDLVQIRSGPEGTAVRLRMRRSV